MKEYYLSKHTYFCLADNHYVFLDLRRNEYLCLGRTHTDLIKGLLNGHQFIDESTPYTRLRSTDSLDPNVVVHTLLERGLLVADDTLGKLLAPPSVDVPSASTMTEFDKPRPMIRPRHVWHFFSAATAASKSLRWDCIERTVRAVEDRKLANATVAPAADSAVITELFQIFRTLRPYYPRSYLCLFDSLALLHFLASYNIFPQWVYGVTVEPFSAHCWVQAGQLVVNDIVDNVRNYTPIMSI